MNEILNNIFDEESIAAIRNASRISPNPETFYKKDEIKVEYASVTPASIVNENSELTKAVINLQKENRELKLKVETQRELIHKIIQSQNEMISEINKIQSQMVMMSSKQSSQNNSSQFAVPENNRVSENRGSSEAPKQQTSMGSSLNPDDFKVENIFYFGNKK